MPTTEPGMTLSIRFRKADSGLFAPLLTLLLLLSASAAPSDVRNEIKETILSYNGALIEAAKNPSFLKDFGDERKFEPFAAKRVAQKLYIWIKSWHENNLYMDAELVKIAFGKIEPKGERAEVLTDETWKYRYFRHIDVNRTAEAWPRAEIYYKVKYTLRFKNGKWKIEDIKVLSEKERKL